MIAISYAQLLTFISIIWILARLVTWFHNKRMSFGRECALLLVYVCIVVVARFTFFPFSLVDGQIQPLILDGAKMLPPRVNFVPFVSLFDYPEMREVLLNLIGNIAMFIPLGIVWPSVFRALDTHKRVILAGVGFSLLIEILQLPFYDRVTDIDDLILNSVGYLIGYGIYLLAKTTYRRAVRKV